MQASQGQHEMGLDTQQGLRLIQENQAASQDSKGQGQV